MFCKKRKELLTVLSIVWSHKANNFVSENRAITFTSGKVNMKPVATCATANVPAYNLSTFDDGLNLGPFDNTYPSQQALGETSFCEAPLGTLSPMQQKAEVVPCSQCPLGFDLGQSVGRDLGNSMTCRPLPLCNNKQCDLCQLDAEHFWVVGPCDMCTSGGSCNSLTGRCQCS